MNANSLFLYYQNHIQTLLFIHLCITFFFSLLLSFYALKRFQKSSKKIDTRDAKRLQYIADRGWFFHFLYSASLHKNNQISIFLFSVLFNLAVPLLGYFFSLWIFIYMVNIEYEEKIIDTGIINLDEFQDSFLTVERLFGDGSLINMINNDYIPRSTKFKALATLAETNSPTSLQIVKQALESKDDEIRMFGYAIINKAETAINSKINKNLAIISQEEKKGSKQNHKRIAEASKELSFLYWEMLYKQLVHESLKENFFHSILTYMKRAKEYYITQIPYFKEVLEELQYSKSDAETQTILQKLQENYADLEKTYEVCANLFILVGRVYLTKGEYNEAKVEFLIAKALLHKNATHLIPYIAELYFLEEKFDTVKTIFQSVPELKYNARLYPIVQQWSDVA